MDWIATIITAFITALSGVSPTVYLALLCSGAFGGGLYLGLYISKDREARAQAALEAAYGQLQTLHESYSNAQKSHGEVLGGIGTTMQGVLETMKQIMDDFQTKRGGPRV